jgi:hypothetical protein
MAAGMARLVAPSSMKATASCSAASMLIAAEHPAGEKATIPFAISGRARAGPEKRLGAGEGVGVDEGLVCPYRSNLVYLVY